MCLDTHRKVIFPSASNLDDSLFWHPFPQWLSMYFYRHCE